MRSISIASAALVAAGTASSAHASLLWDFSFAASPDSASGTLTTDPLNGGSYAITGITGTFDGVTITGLAAPGQGPFGTDNLLYPGPGFLDLDGIGFTLSVGGPETLYGAEGCCTVFDYANGFAGSPGAFSASPVTAPEPASAGLFGASLAAIGLLRWRRRAV
jgi:hypothetical protein